MLQLIDCEMQKQALMDLLLIEQKHCWLTLLLITDNNKRGETLDLVQKEHREGYRFSVSSVIAAVLDVL